ncbi:MAG TPA: iron-sulfur cluster repair di-iron protein, partial [Thermoanaerobaculia bacterium]
MHDTQSLLGRTVGELAAQLPAAIRVFEAWKIDYCCGGTTPLTDACATAGHSVEDFAAAIAAAPDASAGVAVDWQTQDMGAIRNHIVNYYHRYTREELVTLSALAAKVHSVHGHRSPELAEVEKLITELSNDMLPHMLKEEQVLFPYVDELEQAAAGSRVAATPFFGTVKNPVRMMTLEHDRVGELLVNVRAITKDYALPEHACFSYTQLFNRLQEFEAKTHEHIHIENNIYFPRAIALEESAGQTAEFAQTAAGASCCGGH